MKKAEKWLKNVLIVIIKLVLPEKHKGMLDDDWHHFKRVLVFRLDNRLGNSILILSLVQSIKRSLPEVCLDILMTSSYVELYKNHPDIDHIIPYNQKHLFRNPIRFLLLIRELRKNKYDVVFSSNNPDAFSVSQAIFSRLVTQNRNVGFKWKESERLYSDAVSGNMNIHYAQAQYDLWRHFDGNAHYDPPKLYFMELKKSFSDCQILLWLGATGNKFLNEELVDSIIMVIKELDAGIRLAVGPYDRHIKDIYRKPWRDDIHVIDLNIREIAQYFMMYKCICMPDTGPMHLVAALGIPLVQVFVDSNMIQYGYRDSNKFIINKRLNVDSFLKFIRKHIS